MEELINTDEIIEDAVKEALHNLNTESIQIKQSYYTQIRQELDDIAKYFIQINRITSLKRSAGLTNPYAPEYGFNTASQFAYQVTKNKKDQALIYNKINKILSFLRQEQEINYALYIKDTTGNMYRYEVPESEINQFTSIVQTTTFKADQDLRKFSETAIERLENAQRFSEHVEQFMHAIDNDYAISKLHLKLADKYEAFEYHYQMIDRTDESYSHGFNLEGIRKWILARGHDTAGWWVRGDIGLTSVKSVNLNNKFLFLGLATQKSLQEVYQLLTEIFSSNFLQSEQLVRLVKAFTPIVYEVKQGMNVDVNKIVNDLINSLIK